MLYLWVYIAFFSWPLLVPYILDGAGVTPYLPEFFRHEGVKARLPGVILASLLCAVMVAAVQYNTIVHPFTLADNRHYVFYVFRILLRHPSIKIVAVPVYFFSAWATLASMGASKPEVDAQPKGEKEAAGQQATEGRDSFGLSFVLIWLLSSALSLITAPLVEPRYFIIPWVIWRLHVPQISPKHDRSLKGGFNWFPHTDLRLYIETLWYMIINITTGYMFLYRGFEWKQEPDHVQRFMW